MLSGRGSRGLSGRPVGAVNQRWVGRPAAPVGKVGGEAAFSAYTRLQAPT